MRVLCSAILCVLGSVVSAAEPLHVKPVGTDWVWFSDYAYFRSEWTVSAEDGCELEVGSGMRINGEPRGSARRFSRYIKFTAWGIGAIHVRAVAGMAPCLVRVDLGQFDLIPVYGDPSLVKGIIKDGKIVYDKVGGPQNDFTKSVCPEGHSGDVSGTLKPPEVRCDSSASK